MLVPLGAELRLAEGPVRGLLGSQASEPAEHRQHGDEHGQRGEGYPQQRSAHAVVELQVRCRQCRPDHRVRTMAERAVVDEGLTHGGGRGVVLCVVLAGVRHPGGVMQGQIGVLAVAMRAALRERRTAGLRQAQPERGWERSS